MFNIYVIPATENTKSNKTIALYTTVVNATSNDEQRSIVNYGVPSMAPYNPIFGNMYGFESAPEKYYFEVISEEECAFYNDSPIYLVCVNDDRKVAQGIYAMNELAVENPIFTSNNGIFKASVEEEKSKKKAL